MRRLLGFVAGLVLSATLSAQTPVSPDRDEMYRYVLTMDTVHKIAAVQKTLDKTAPDVARPVAKLKSTDDLVQALIRAMMAVSMKTCGGAGANMYAAPARDVCPANQVFVEQPFDNVRSIFDHNGSSPR